MQLIGEDVEFVKIDGVVNDLPKDYAAPVKVISVCDLLLIQSWGMVVTSH